MFKNLVLRFTPLFIVLSVTSLMGYVFAMLLGKNLLGGVIIGLLTLICYYSLYVIITLLFDNEFIGIIPGILASGYIAFYIQFTLFPNSSAWELYRIMIAGSFLGLILVSIFTILITKSIFSKPYMT